jgi:ABC-2 type transport system permease protein
MVAEFLKLKLRLIGNTFVRTPRQNIAVAITGLICIALAVAAAWVLSSLVAASSDEARTTIVLGGSVVMLAFIVVPLVSRADDALDPRRFALFGIPSAVLARGLAIAGIVSLPVVLTLVVALFTVPVWSQNAAAALLAVFGALVAVASAVLASRLAALVAAVALSTRRSREAAGLIAVLLLLLASPAIVLWVTVHGGRGAAGLAEAAADALSWSPLGAAWALPADAAIGASGAQITIKLLIAIAFLAVLWFSWRGLVARVLVSAQRNAPEREHANLGWFARTPSTRTGAVAARSFTYWARDARYPVPVIGVFGFLVVVFVAFVVAGIPLTYLVLLTVPAFCATLAFSVHNDVALDNSAVWLHVSASRVGLADRLGRAVPVLAMGVPLIAVGSVAAAYFADDFDALPALLGVSTVLLSGSPSRRRSFLAAPGRRRNGSRRADRVRSGSIAVRCSVCVLRDPRPHGRCVGVLVLPLVGCRGRRRRSCGGNDRGRHRLRSSGSRHPCSGTSQLEIDATRALCAHAI